MVIQGNFINDIFINKQIKILHQEKSKYIKIKELISLIKSSKDYLFKSISENDHEIIVNKDNYKIINLSSLEFDIIQDLINKNQD